MQDLFNEEAAKYNVLPLDNRSFARAVEPRPSTTAGKTEFTYTGVNPGIATANAPNLLDRSYTITAEVDVPEGGGDGMIATVGGAGAAMGCTY
jgi:arylsulfatase